MTNDGHDKPPAPGGEQAGDHAVDKRADTATGDRRSTATRRRRGRTRPFPILPFEEALTLGQAIQRTGTFRIRRLTLFEHLNRSPDSGTTRALITASNQYGITTGSYTAEWLELTPDGRIATAAANDVSVEDRFRARFRLAIQRNSWFSLLYEQLKDARLPAAPVIADTLREAGLEDEFVNECVEHFIVDAKFLGLLRLIAGAERLLPVEHVVEEYLREDSPDDTVVPGAPIEDHREADARGRGMASPTGLDDVCFYIAPIGAAGSEHRKHSDLFMASLVEPALQELGLRLVRADDIAKPGLITAQVIEYIVKCPLVIADLSYHNPNVFYELALRHAIRKPIVQVIRRADSIPFDLHAVRTIEIDTSDIYSLVPQIETYRAEIAAQARVALDSRQEGENLLSAFFPGFWDAMSPRVGEPARD